jgi:alkaline phosphatase
MPVLGLFEQDGLTTNAPEPTLAEMAETAMNLLASDRDGFFLMVEGGQIDWQCHANNADGAIKQAKDFDAAVGKALEFAKNRGDTLVVVTADHETGGLTIVYPDAGSTAKFATKWTTLGHSGCNVALFAYGPGAESFRGLIDNTDIPKKFANLWKISDFAGTAPIPVAAN